MCRTKSDDYLGTCGEPKAWKCLFSRTPYHFMQVDMHVLKMAFFPKAEDERVEWVTE